MLLLSSWKMIDLRNSKMFSVQSDYKGTNLLRRPLHISNTVHLIYSTLGGRVAAGPRAFGRTCILTDYTTVVRVRICVNDLVFASQFHFH